jgi:hypothetical protein
MTMTQPPRRPKVPRKSVQVSVTRLQLLLDGTLTIEELDDEEIRRMQLKDSTGSFKGRPPLWIPHSLALAFKQEFFRRFQSELGEMIPDAMKAIKEQLNSRHLSPGDATRLRAAELVIDRVFGKVTQNVDQHVTLDKGKSFEDFVGDALVDVEEEE